MTTNKRGRVTRAVAVAAVAFAGLALSACFFKKSTPNDGALRAIAHLQDTLGREIGIVRLTERPGTRGVEVDISVERGAMPGQHGIHFHEVGKCDSASAFASAGGHFNPTNRKHGLFNPEGPHAGDLEAITVDAFRQSHFVVPVTRISLTPGTSSLMDADGTSIVLHALPDDQRTDPAGNSGARIACGVVTRL
jgi:superoxide dismutase, Cu-Zn family